MKHNTLKRTLAAGLAVLCAAAYVPTFGNTGLFDIAITASATDYDSENRIVNAFDLRPGDTISTGVSGIVSARDYTFILKGGTFGTGYYREITDVCSEDVVVSGNNFRLNAYNYLQIIDYSYSIYTRYYPVNENGEYSDKLYVLDVTGDKITLGGYGNVTTCTATFTDAMIDKFRVRINSDFFAVDSSTDAAKDTAYTIKGDRNGNVEVWVIMPTGTTFTPSDITITMGDTALDVETEQGVFDDDENVSYCIYSFSRSSVTEDLVFDYNPTVDVTGVTLNKESTTLTVGAEETLTATVAPEGATDQTLTWTSSDPSVATVDANGTITAVGAGKATITATATNGTESTDDDVRATCEVTVSDGIGALLVGYSLSLDGDIGVNFYMELADDVAASDTAYMQFTIPAGSETVTKTVPVKEAGSGTVNSKTYHVFKCNVSAKDMASQITAQIINGDNKGTKYTYSVKDYAEYLLQHTDVAAYANAAPLVKAMLNYGTYAQEYFGCNTDKPANASLSADDKALGVVNIPNTFKYVEGDTTLPAGVTFAGATLSLKSETTLSLYFTGLPDNTVFTCEGKDNVESVKNGSYMVARIRGIKAEELKSNFTVTFTGGSVTYNAMTYCYNVLNGGTTNDALKNVCRALYQYAETASPNS
ncbi:MAG: Ig domain-containing protein [Oscillospiraceae bacterium]|nr:Ig domain-containing protein [Oscillospiraceae bacterium]